MDRRDPIEIILQLFVGAMIVLGLGLMITRTIDTIVEVQQQQAEVREFKG